MKVIIYSKEGCQYCDHAVTLCESENLEYEKVMIDKEELKKLCDGSVITYPQIFIDGRRIGTYFDFQDKRAWDFLAALKVQRACSRLFLPEVTNPGFLQALNV